MGNIKCRESYAQSYQCQVMASLPSSLKKVAFDACLAKEIFWLWDNGIVTIGSCCGRHKELAKATAYIQVEDRYIGDMKKLGYKEDKNYSYSPCNSFVPKTKLKGGAR